MDCEEESCSSESACEEGDCTDGLDGDEDGLVDCDDDDCWGDVCRAGQVRLTEGRMHLRWVRVDIDVSSDGTSDSYFCVGSHVNQEVIQFYADLQGGAGTLRATTVGGWASCHWSFDSGEVAFSHRRAWGNNGGTWDGTYCYESPGFDWASSHVTPAERAGFSIEPGCGVYTSGFLPADLRVEDWSRPNAPWLVGDNVWYQGAGERTFSSEDGSGHAGRRQYTTVNSWTFPTLDSGDWVEIGL